VNSQDFLLQGSGNFQCWIYALVNAARSYGMPTPEPGTPEWDTLVTLGYGWTGPVTRPATVAEALGLHLSFPKGPERYVQNGPHSFVSAGHLPPQGGLNPNEKHGWHNIVAVKNPEPVGCSLHVCLHIGWFEKLPLLVNYRWLSGPVIEAVKPEYPAEPNDKVWIVRPMQDNDITLRKLYSMGRD